MKVPRFFRQLQVHLKTSWRGLSGDDLTKGHLSASLLLFPLSRGKGRGVRGGCFCCGTLGEGRATPFSLQVNRDAGSVGRVLPSSSRREIWSQILATKLAGCEVRL